MYWINGMNLYYDEFIPHQKFWVYVWLSLNGSMLETRFYEILQRREDNAQQQQQQQQQQIECTKEHQW